MAAQFQAATFTTILEFALYYASLGWGVFPAHTIRNYHCSCGKADCASPGKHPRTRNGLKDATTNRSTILEWWQKSPDANIAIRTGIESGLIVLDVDTKSNGFDSLDTLQNTFEKLPETLTAITGGGGNHICFSHPGIVVKNRGNLLGGIDFRGDNGYIIAPPSLHKSDNRYSWIELNTPLSQAPEWLIDLVNGTGKTASEYGVSIIPEGNRNNSLMSIAGKKWNEGISTPVLRTFLLEENQIKCKPPLPHDEVIKLLESVTSYEQGEIKFIHTWKDCFRNSNLPSSSKLVLHALADHMNSSGRSCYPTQEQLSKETSLTRRTVGKHLELCAERGWIERYPHRALKQEFWNYGYIASLPDE
jgi:hypothetical protein